MTVGFAEGGASSAVGVAANGANWLANYPVATGPRGVFGMYAVMSNELNTPKILYCPSESAGTIQQGNVFGNTTASVTGFFSDAGTSYFVGVDANETSPSMFLAGDHNLGFNANQATHVGNGNYFVSAGTNTTWTATAIGWQDNQHNKQGNVGLADGSVQGFSTSALRTALNNTGDQGRTAGVFANVTGSLGTGVNRLQMPKYN